MFRERYEGHYVTIGFTSKLKYDFYAYLHNITEIMGKFIILVVLLKLGY